MAWPGGVYPNVCTINTNTPIIPNVRHADTLITPAHQPSLTRAAHQPLRKFHNNAY